MVPAFTTKDTLQSLAAQTIPDLASAGRVLVTGASGFIGRQVVSELAAAGVETRAAMHRPHPGFPGGVEVAVGAALEPTHDWRPTLAECRTVIHTASLVHQMDGPAAPVNDGYRRVNVLGTLRLARDAAEVGVRRFVFLSSIKVNGESTSPGIPFFAFDLPAPVDAYGVSKAEAERELRTLAAFSGLEVVIIRPVLVYGPGVKGNFLSLLRVLARGLPLPLRAVRNRRSLVGLRNLTSLILTCVAHPAAANETFLVSDGEDLSTTELLVRTARALGRRARLIPLPASLLRIAARALGKDEVARRLLDTLQVDIGRTRQLLHWTPSVSVDDELVATARWFLSEARVRG